MLTKFIFAFYLFATFSNNYSQNIVKLFNKSVSYTKEGNFNDAIQIYKKLEKKAINKAYYAYNIIYFAYKGNIENEFYPALKRIISYDLSEYEEVYKNRFEVVFIDWRDSLDLYYHVEKQKKLNHNLKVDSIKLHTTLSNMYKRETFYRNQANEFYVKMNAKEITYEQFKPTFDSLMKLQNPLDSLDQLCLDSLVWELGELPNLSYLSKDEFHTIFIIIQHMENVKKREYYQKLYRKCIKNHLAPVKYYPIIYDRTQSMSNKKLKFGLAVKLNEKGEKVYSTPLKRKRIVNKNRVLYGLSPINL